MTKPSPSLALRVSARIRSGGRATFALSRGGFGARRGPPRHAVIASAAVATLAAWLSACGPSGAAGAPGVSTPKKGPVTVQVQPIHDETVERVVELSGTLFGAEEVLVAAEVDGRVERVAADLGDVVKQGAPLIQLQGAVLRFAAEQAEADYLTALARLGVTDAGLDSVDVEQIALVRRARADLDEALRNRARMQELFGKSVVSQHDLDTVETRARVAEAAAQVAHEEAAAALATARARRAAAGLARQHARDATIAAPFTGLVAERLVSLGEYVRVGQPVARLVVSEVLTLKGDVAERYAAVIHQGMPVSVSVDAQRGVLEGKIARVGPSINPTTRTFRVEASIPNASAALKPGLFARASVVVGEDERVFAVPETAVATVAGAAKLFTLDDGTAREHRVTVLRKRGSDALIVPLEDGALTSGDLAIVTGVSRLFDGAAVNIDGGAGGASAEKRQVDKQPAAPPAAAPEVTFPDAGAPADAGNTTGAASREGAANTVRSRG